LTKTPLIDSLSCFNLGAWSFVWGVKPTKAPQWLRDWFSLEQGFSTGALGPPWRPRSGSPGTTSRGLY